MEAGELSLAKDTLVKGIRILKSVKYDVTFLRESFEKKLSELNKEIVKN
jgi:hypothetical protein